MHFNFLYCSTDEYNFKDKPLGHNLKSDSDEPKLNFVEPKK